MDQAQLTQESVTASIRNVENLFVKSTCDPVCQDKQNEVMQCFSDNPKHSLRCADIVSQFSSCVDLSRLVS